ncbi:MAG: cob(I)yrinic acid a,c-diamide adenosyltransferase [Oleiphilaceae bacterium]|nr:cob(I)yrinic acid a,c-diamide adenosyltransferase [Oleiphilaceae bacterium]
MGNRLSKIYTKTGDDGSTGLGDGNRIGKNTPRVEAMGSVDELNCQMGLLIEELDPEDKLTAILKRIQHHLFDLGGEISIPGAEMIKGTHSEWLENHLDHYNADLPPLKNFILPGGSKAAAQCHMARAICRRAERDVVTLSQVDTVNMPSQHYLNRLSDFLFVVARVLVRLGGAQEVLWEQTS